MARQRETLPVNTALQIISRARRCKTTSQRTRQGKITLQVTRLNSVFTARTVSTTDGSFLPEVPQQSNRNTAKEHSLHTNLTHRGTSLQSPRRHWPVRSRGSDPEGRDGYLTTPHTRITKLAHSDGSIVRSSIQYPPPKFILFSTFSDVPDDKFEIPSTQLDNPPRFLDAPPCKQPRHRRWPGVYTQGHRGKYGVRQNEWKWPSHKRNV